MLISGLRLCLCYSPTFIYDAVLRIANICINNSLTPGKCGSNFRSIFQTPCDNLGTRSEVTVKGMPLNFPNESIFPQVMSTSLYLNQYWHRSMSPYGITMSQWVITKHILSTSELVRMVLENYILAEESVQFSLTISNELPRRQIFHRKITWVSTNSFTPGRQMRATAVAFIRLPGVALALADWNRAVCPGLCDCVMKGYLHLVIDSVNTQRPEQNVPHLSDNMLSIF